MGVGTNQESKVSQVAAEVEQLHREIEFCYKEFGSLTERLVNVIQTNKVGIKDEQKVPELSLVPLADNLRTCNSKIRTLGEQFSFLRESIEL